MLLIQSIGGNGCFVVILKGKDLDYWDGIWKSDANYFTNHFSTIFTFEEETEIYFSYFKSIPQTSSNVYLTLTAVKVAE